MLVIGQDQFLEPAQGIIWDCRGFAHGLPAVPLDFNAPVSSDLNSDYIEHVLSDWPDQELKGFLLDGVDFRADLPLQIVLGPHLVSLAKAWTNAHFEILRLAELGYHDLHQLFPYLPLRDVPQGSAPRKHEVGRDRRTSDGGFPRKSACDRTGTCAVSLNDAIGLHSFTASEAASDSTHEDDDAPDDVFDEARTSPKWNAPEVKPRIEDKAWDDSILLHAGHTVFKEPINGFTDDFADYFNQIPLAPAYYWTACFSWWMDDDASDYTLKGFQDTPTPPITYVAEKRLGFGVSLSSNVAQRFSESVVADFRSRFDAQELKHFADILDPVTHVCVPNNVLDATTLVHGWTNACRWIDARRTLSRETGLNQLRLYSVHIYTDDPVFTVVGTERLLRAMRVWHDVTSAWGLRMAIARKRQVGPCVSWLGFNFYLPFGIIAVTPEKIFRAQSLMNSILQGAAVAFNEYRSLVGLLEHLLLFVGGDRTFMYHLYGRNFRAGIRGGPLTRMVFHERHFRAMRRWSQTLAQRTGCFCSAALTASSVVIPPLRSCLQHSSLFLGGPPISDSVFSLYSDAYVLAAVAGPRDDIRGGLGGYAHGCFWHHSLPRHIANLLHITSWEFLAYALNVIVFSSVVAGQTSYWYADATSTVTTMIRFSSRSPAMQIIHELLIHTPEYLALGLRSYHSHVSRFELGVPRRRSGVFFDDKSDHASRFNDVSFVFLPINQYGSA